MKDTRQRDTLAGQLFAARRQLDRLESMLYDILEEELGMVFEDTRFDPYDDSLELDEVQAGVRLSPKTLQRVWDMGFLRVWLNHLDGWETYYYRGGPADGHRKAPHQTGEGRG